MIQSIIMAKNKSDYQSKLITLKRKRFLNFLIYYIFKKKIEENELGHKFAKILLKV
jgi:hypothetical protein